jgi:hypothetical protein
MTNKHLNDAEIQQYVLQKTNCDTDIIEHIQHCRNCKIKAEQYNLLFEGIKQQEKPVFDFNLADLVVAQLPKSQHKVSNEKSFFYFIIFIAIISVCIVFYLFANNLLNLFQGIARISIGLIIITGASLLVFLCIDMYRTYQIQIKTLNFY